MSKALLVVDAQKDFMNTDGALYVPDAMKIKKTIGNVIKFFRSRDIPVMFTQDCHDGSEPEMNTCGEVFPLHCMVGTIGQDNIDEAIPNDDEPVYTKQCYDVFDSKFGNPIIKQTLKDLGVTEIWMVGCATDYCIKAAALGLHKLGVEVYIFEDAIRGG